MRTIASKMADLENTVGNTDTEFGSIRQELRLKASITKTEQIDLQLIDCATKNDFSKVINRLEAFTTLESFNKMRINSEREYQDLCHKVSALVP